MNVVIYCTYHPQKETQILTHTLFCILSNDSIDVVCVSQVRDSKHKCSLGCVRVALGSLLKEVDMTQNQQFPLQNSGPNSTLKLKMALRVGVSVCDSFVCVCFIQHIPYKYVFV